MLANEFIRLPYQAVDMPPNGVRWGKAHKDFMRKAYRRTIEVMGPTQEMPVFDSRVQLDPSVKDFWGMPVAQLSGYQHPHTLEIASVMARRRRPGSRKPALSRPGASVPGNGVSGGQHQAGTCRMGNDPKTSVVDSWCRVHDIDNLYVIDGSVHVTNGGFNPALTILANAYRARLSPRAILERKSLAMAFLHSRVALLALAIGILIVLGLPAASLYYEYSAGASCARCHEIRSEHSSWQTSTHRAVACGACHGEILTFDPGFHLGNARRLVQHIRGAYRDPIRLRNLDVNSMVGRCQKCHQQEAAQWQNGPHGVTYETVFLDQKHNRSRLLMDDCLRCHGMFFEGGIRELVTPLNTEGPWKLLPASVVHQPVIPCLTCHAFHRSGDPLHKETTTMPRLSPPAAKNSIGLPSASSIAANAPISPSLFCLYL